MPKILERSHSTEPNLSSFPNDPSPMKYLRQQSLPPPKFTATVEATIARTSVPETSAAGGCGSPSKSVPPSAVPMLTPKPYTQPKASQEVLKTFKVGWVLWEANGKWTLGSLWKEAFWLKKYVIIVIKQKPNTLNTIVLLYFRRFGSQILKGWVFLSVLLYLLVNSLWLTRFLHKQGLFPGLLMMWFLLEQCKQSLIWQYSISIVMWMHGKLKVYSLLL